MELSTNTRVSPLSATPPRGLAGLNEPLASYLLARSYVLAGGGENFRAERAMMRVDSSSLWLDGVGQTGDHRPTRPPGPPPDQGERSPWGVWRLTRRGGREGASVVPARASRWGRQTLVRQSDTMCLTVSLRSLAEHSHSITVCATIPAVPARRAPACCVQALRPTRQTFTKILLRCLDSRDRQAHTV